MLGSWVLINLGTYQFRYFLCLLGSILLVFFVLQQVAMRFYTAEPFISLLNLGSPVACITVEICMSFCTSGLYAGSRELLFFSCFCLISAAQQHPCSAAAPLHLLKSDVSGKRTLWHCATSVKSACAAGGAGAILLAEPGLDALPLPHAFVTFLFLNAAFFQC